MAPDYLSDLIPHYLPNRSLRSEHQGQIVVPRYRLDTFGGRTFAVQASRLWNSLDSSVRESGSLAGFKTGLKTLLFQEYFL